MAIEVECRGECWCAGCRDAGEPRPCGFEGEVDAEVDGSRLVWECPACGTEQVEDTEDRFGPDPDEAYERQRDEDAAS